MSTPGGTIDFDTGTGGAADVPQQWTTGKCGSKPGARLCRGAGPVEAGSEARSSQLGRAARTEDRRGLRQGRRDMAAGAPRVLQVPVATKARFPLQLGPSDVLVERKATSWRDGSSQSNLAEPERGGRVQGPNNLGHIQLWVVAETSLAFMNLDIIL